MQVLAIAYQKGGAGKTTLTVAILTGPPPHFSGNRVKFRSRAQYAGAQGFIGAQPLYVVCLQDKKDTALSAEKAAV
jgi:hypothetical protein